MNRITILVVAGLSIATSACATQPAQQPMSRKQAQASFDCQYPLAVDAGNYDALSLASGRPAVDEHGNPFGLSLRGYVSYAACMSRKGYEIADSQPE